MGLSMSAWGYSRLGFVTAERKDIVHDIFYCFFFISFFHYFIYFCSCISIPSPHGLNDSTTFFLSILFPYVVHSIRSHWMLHRYSPLESWLTDFDYWTLEPLVIAKPNPTRSRSRSIFNPSISSWRSRTFWCFHHVNIKIRLRQSAPKEGARGFKECKELLRASHKANRFVDFSFQEKDRWTLLQDQSFQNGCLAFVACEVSCLASSLERK